MAIYVLLNPIDNDRAEDVESEFHGNELTPRSVFDGFSSSDRSDGVQDTSSDAVEDTSWRHH
jgi:hypothetical protein